MSKNFTFKIILLSGLIGLFVLISPFQASASFWSWLKAAISPDQPFSPTPINQFNQPFSPTDGSSQSQPFQPIQSGQPGQNFQPSQPGQPIQNQPMQSGQPGQPGQPGQFQPMQPMQPGQPFQSYQPGEPGQFNLPGQNQNQSGQPPQPGGQQPGQFQPGQPGGSTQQGGQPQQPFQPGQGGTQMQQPMAPIIEEEEGQQNDYVDPQEIKNVTKDMKNMMTEIKKFIKQLKKIQNTVDDIAKLNEMLTQLQDFTNKIKNPPEDYTQREVLQEFYDQNYWETMQSYRAKIEIPNEITRLQKDIKKLEGMLKLKAYQKLGLNLDTIKAKLNEIKEAIKIVQADYQAGNFEDAMTGLEPIREGSQPGDMMCALNGLKDMTRELGLIRDKDIKAQIQEIIQPIIDGANDGEYRDSCQSLNEIRNEIIKIMKSIRTKKGTLPQATRDKLDIFKQTIEQKFGGEEAPPPTE